MKQYIYGIFKTSDKLNPIYIGKTDDCKRRFRQHLNNIKNGKHEYISKEEYNDEIMFNVLYEVNNVDKNNYLIDMVENCVISSFESCRNDIVINKKHYDKLEVNLER